MSYTIQDVIDKMRSLAPPLKEVPDELLSAWVVLPKSSFANPGSGIPSLRRSH